MKYKSIELVIFGLIAMLFWVIDYWRIGRKPLISIPAKYYKGRLRFFRLLVFAIGATGWILLSLGLGGPQEPLGKKHVPKKLNDVIFVVDVSASMRTVDFDPNRLEASKKTILEFIKMRPKDRIGVIAFAKKAFTLLPLSTDTKLVEQSIKKIKIGYAGIGQGTNIGDAIGLGVARAALSSAKKKTIILLTDGVSNVGNLTPEQAATEAAKSKIRIHVIGLVNEGRKAQMPLTDKNGNVIYNRLGQTRMIRVPGGSVDKSSMGEIAKITGGSFQLAGDVKALKRVFTEIDKLERSEVKTLSGVRYRDLYWNYILLGVLLVLLVEFVRRFVLREGI